MIVLPGDVAGAELPAEARLAFAGNHNGRAFVPAKRTWRGWRT